MTLIAALSGFTIATHAQLVVWGTNFDNEPLGPYPGPINFCSVCSGDLAENIVAPGDGGTGRCMEVTFNITNGTVINIQAATREYPASGNTNTQLSAYTLEFDMAIQGETPGFGMQISVFKSDDYVWNGGVSTDIAAPSLPTAGSGYQHYSLPLSTFTPKVGGFLIPTDSAFSVGFGVLGVPATITATPETIDVDNVYITMNTNPPPPPPRPTMTLLPAKPGLRIFAQNTNATYIQEGFGTVDTNQSWVGVATLAHPVSYAITFADFDTVDNYMLYAQFVQGANPGDPYGVYNGQNALVWSITHLATGFTTAIDWKTNLPTSLPPPNNALTLTTATTKGRGTWTLTFTNDTDGTVAAPDGASGSFSLPPDAAALFANPLTIDFGTAPNNTAGYGQWIDISRISITNIVDGNEFDDFTKDDVLNTNLWNPGFSINAGSVIQVSTNTPYWVNWTVPDAGFGLGTKADLSNTSIPWYSPGYYSGGTVTPTPRQMGPSLKWVLIPSTCLPTMDGTTDGMPSTKGFFRLSNPAPTQ